MKLLVCSVALLMCMGTASVSASTIEDTTGVCYQNDGQTSFGTNCDFPDSVASASEATCNTDTEFDGGRTSGTLVALHQQPGVPEEDPADFCLAPIYPQIPSGTLVQVDLELSSLNVESSFPMSIHIWDPQTGEEVVSSTSASLDATASTQDVETAVHSGDSRQSFHPISVSKVVVDGVERTSLARTQTTVGVLDFVVKNDPQVMTIAGVERSLHLGDVVRLCGFSGDLTYALTALGGNIKFNGVAQAIEFGSSLGTTPSCIGAARVTCSSENGYQNSCQFYSTPAVPNLIFEIRAHPSQSSTAGPIAALPSGPGDLIQPQPKHCHDACVLGPGPGDWLSILSTPEQF